MKLNSTMLSDAEYNESEKTLTIKFAKGGEYIFKDVPKSIYDELIAAESAGKYFLSNIKNKYVVEKVI